VINISHTHEQKTNQISFKGMMEFYSGAIRKLKESKERRMANKQQSQPID